MNGDTSAFVAYLRCEANMAADKAIQLREMADNLVAGIPIDHSKPETEIIVESEVVEYAPLDEYGVPKYKGKRRGRKSKKRKRQRNPSKTKRQHTAYTFFVQTNYPNVKAENPEHQSKDVITILAKQWADVPEIERKNWQQRAKSNSVQNSTIVDDVQTENEAHGMKVEGVSKDEKETIGADFYLTPTKEKDRLKDIVTLGA